MTFTIRGSHILALLITLAIGAWMYEGEIRIGGNGEPTVESKPIAEREAETSSELFKVAVTTIEPTQRIRNVVLRGRTKAEAIIPIRAETAGVLEKRFVKRGDFVKEGQLVCQLARGAREANMERVEARLQQTQALYDANQKLVKQGFATDTQARQILFDLNAAKAEKRQAEIELEYTNITATASGTVMDPIAEAGDVMSVGSTCIPVADTSPMFFTGQLSEADITSVKTNMSAGVELITGVRTKGTITYIAAAADPATRTFLTEIRLDEAGEDVRDGLTATASIELPAKDSFLISPSWITLADTGEVGLKLVDEQDQVVFNPITIISQTKQGFWVEGLKKGARIITRGQEYVISGEKVQPVEEAIVSAAINTGVQQ